MLYIFTGLFAKLTDGSIYCFLLFMGKNNKKQTEGIKSDRSLGNECIFVVGTEIVKHH